MTQSIVAPEAAMGIIMPGSLLHLSRSSYVQEKGLFEFLLSQEKVARIIGCSSYD